MTETKLASLQTRMRTSNEWELILRGKELLTVEQWEKFAFCHNCLKKKCAACVSRPSGLTYEEQFQEFYFSCKNDPDDDDPVDQYIPRKLWDIKIECCSCGSSQHITEWLREALAAEHVDWPELHEALLRAAKEEQESQTNGDNSIVE